MVVLIDSFRYISEPSSVIKKSSSCASNPKPFVFDKILAGRRHKSPSHLLPYPQLSVSYGAYGTARDWEKQKRTK